MKNWTEDLDGVPRGTLPPSYRIHKIKKAIERFLTMRNMLKQCRGMHSEMYGKFVQQVRLQISNLPPKHPLRKTLSTLSFEALPTVVRNIKWALKNCMKDKPSKEVMRSLLRMLRFLPSRTPKVPSLVKKGVEAYAVSDEMASYYDALYKSLLPQLKAVLREFSHLYNVYRIQPEKAIHERMRVSILSLATEDLERLITTFSKDNLSRVWRPK